MHSCFTAKIFHSYPNMISYSLVYTNVYSCSRGEVKLMVDPEAHYHQFQRFLNKCEDLLEQE